jgi:hypothetical protein
MDRLIQTWLAAESTAFFEKTLIFLWLHHGMILLPKRF